MSVSDIKNTGVRITQDNKVTQAEADQLLQSGGSISKSEERALKKVVNDFTGTYDPGVEQKLREKLGEIPGLRARAAEINREVSLDKRGLDADIKSRLTSANGTTFGGTKIPDAVKKLVNTAITTGGVTPYDVREMKPDPVYSTEHGDAEMTIDGQYNPYAQEQEAVDSMAFAYTELTPEKIAKDISTTQTWREVDGYTGTGNQQQAKFKTVSGKPTGRITELYDEASWSETKARGPGGQKYASNFAILADGSFHAVPASRRTAAEPWRILTTASLARGKQMLFNGHIHANEQGVITYVGLSGRLSKLQEKGEAKFIDPIALLQAWGFKIAPGLQVSLEG